MKKKECIIFGSTGVLSKSVIELFYEKGFFIYGVSKKSKQSLKINNYSHIFFNIKRKLSKKIKNIILSKYLKFIVFILSKKEINKNIEHDTNLLLDYHLFFPIKIAEQVKNKKINLILINSDSFFKKKVNFAYSLSKLASAYFIRFSNDFFPNLKFFSIIMSRVNNKNLIKFKYLLNKIIKNHLKNKSQNFFLEKKKKYLKFN